MVGDRLTVRPVERVLRPKSWIVGERWRVRHCRIGHGNGEWRVRRGRTLIDRGNSLDLGVRGRGPAPSWRNKGVLSATGSRTDRGAGFGWEKRKGGGSKNGLISGRDGKAEGRLAPDDMGRATRRTGSRGLRWRLT